MINSTWQPRIVVHVSHRKNNAPPGYLIVRVFLAPGLFVESELNPYTKYQWSTFYLCQGYEDDRDKDTVFLGAFKHATDEIGQLFSSVRDWFMDGEYFFGVESIAFKFTFAEGS